MVFVILLWRVLLAKLVTSVLRYNLFLSITGRRSIGGKTTKELGTVNISSKKLKRKVYIESQSTLFLCFNVKKRVSGCHSAVGIGSPDFENNNIRIPNLLLQILT